MLVFSSFVTGCLLLSDFILLDFYWVFLFLFDLWFFWVTLCFVNFTDLKTKQKKNPKGLQQNAILKLPARVLILLLLLLLLLALLFGVLF